MRGYCYGIGVAGGVVVVVVRGDEAGEAEGGGAVDSERFVYDHM